MKINEAIQQALGTTIDDNKVLYDYYVSELNNVLEAKQSLEQLEKDIRSKIAKYGTPAPKQEKPSATINTDIKVDLYPMKGSWTEKIEFILGQTGDLTGKEVVNFIEEIQPELRGKSSSSVYPTLSDNSKPGKKFTKYFDKTLKVNKFKLNNK